MVAAPSPITITKYRSALRIGCGHFWSGLAPEQSLPPYLRSPLCLILFPMDERTIRRPGGIGCHCDRAQPQEHRIIINAPARKIFPGEVTIRFERNILFRQRVTRDV